MIKQTHVNECDSTQDLLKEQLNKESPAETILISCEYQTSGRGRGDNLWKAMPGTLCFSLNIQPHAVMSFTALELSVLVARFFESKNIDLKLKWPNDLWNKDLKKCGGILVQGTQNLFYAGIGLNLYSSNESFGGIFDREFQFDKKELAREVAEFILNHRYSDTDQLQKDWLLRCGHLNEIVIIADGIDRIEGVFQGLGKYGEALVCRDGRINKLFNGSLRLPYN